MPAQACSIAGDSDDCHSVNEKHVRCVQKIEEVTDAKEAETILECSAKGMVYVGEVFYYAIKSVLLHPVKPLFNMHEVHSPPCTAGSRQKHISCPE